MIMRFIKIYVVVLMVVIFGLSTVGCDDPEIREMNNRILGHWVYEEYLIYTFNNDGKGTFTIHVVDDVWDNIPITWKIISGDSNFILSITDEEETRNYMVISLTQNSLIIFNTESEQTYEYTRMYTS